MLSGNSRPPYIRGAMLCCCCSQDAPSRSICKHPAGQNHTSAYSRRCFSGSHSSSWVFALRRIANLVAYLLSGLAICGASMLASVLSSACFGRDCIKLCTACREAAAQWLAELCLLTLTCFVLCLLAVSLQERIGCLHSCVLAWPLLFAV